MSLKSSLSNINFVDRVWESQKDNSGLFLIIEAVLTAFATSVVEISGITALAK